MKRTVTHLAIAATALTLVACITDQSGTGQTSRSRRGTTGSTTTKVSVQKPTITPLPETQPRQEKGGIEITVTPVTYTVVERPTTSDRTLREGVEREYILGGQIYETPVRDILRTTTPALATQPEGLQFQVKVVNKMPRVFRAQGMVVQFNVGGKLIPVDAEAYKELINMILPPRNEHTVHVYGPPTKELPATATVGLFFYDIPTATDNAGNITEKQTFEWYHAYAAQLDEREVTVTTEKLQQPIGPRKRVK